MDLQNEKCVMVIDESLPLGIIEIKKKSSEIFPQYSGEHDFIKTVIGFGYKFNLSGSDSPQLAVQQTFS